MTPTLNSQQQQILDQLMAGNQRFVRQQAENPRQTIAQRRHLLQAQFPVAAVLSCADSRVPPEIVFDQGLGDLFVVRVAGNVLNEHIIASLEFATVQIKAPLIIVMGHSLCGAVQASMSGDALPGHLAHIAAELEPSITAARAQSSDKHTFAIQHNARHVAAELPRRSPLIARAIDNGQCAVKPAYYNMATGVVELL
jgi:carbonic anhydrase